VYFALLYCNNVLINFALMFESRTVFAEVFLFLGFTLVRIFYSTVSWSVRCPLPCSLGGKHIPTQIVSLATEKTSAHAFEYFSKGLLGRELQSAPPCRNRGAQAFTQYPPSLL